MPSVGGSKQRLEIFDSIEGSAAAESSDDDEMRPSGCYVSSLVGFALLLAAVLVAVGVGVIVFFASPGKEVKCVCEYPPMATASPDEQWRQCAELSVSRNECLDTPACTGITSTPPASTTTAPPVVANIRLPTDLIPEAYVLDLYIDIYGDDPEKFTYSGTVNIIVNCTKTTGVVVLHAKKLQIEGVQVAASPPTTASPEYDRMEMDSSAEFLKIYVKNGEFQQDEQYRITIEFKGQLKDDLGGIYRSSYNTSANGIRYIATTQMEPTDARKSFPCFDEPALKATFEVTLWRKDPMISLSNMHQVGTSAGTGGWIGDHYAVSPKMPTYLLAFIICDFVYKNATTTTGTEVRVWARPDAIDTVDYALWTGVNITEYFETYFGIKFPLEKQDMIAIPDFAAGAMENWGLITYRETALLYDPKVSSEYNKQRVVTVVSHELAHQWFGNLVSPSWWDDLWLNEGFASYVEYLGVNNVHRDWAMMDQFVSMDLHDVFTVDGLANSHPIYVPVNHPDEINEIFDKISYSKGASIIRMMNGFLGEDTFTIGLTNYLRRHAYANANNTDLWTALGEQAAADGLTLNVPEIMNSWILQMGYPVVKMDTAFGKVRVSQKHFLMDYTQSPSSKYPSPYQYKWDIPLTYITADSNTEEKSMWLYRDKEYPDISAPSSWILGNYKQIGYYRVNYDESNWDKLITQLQTDHSVFHVRNRAQLIDDAFNLGRNGDDLDQRYGLKATLYLTNETEYVPWDTAENNLGYFKKMFKFHGSYGHLQKYVLKLVLPHYVNHGWDIQEDDLHLEKYLKTLWISLACVNGNSDCTDEAVNRFKQWQNNPENNTIIPDLKSLTYCIAVANGGIEEWEFVRQQFKVANNANEKINLLYAMSCTTKPWILSKYLNNALNPEEIRKQDAVSALVYASRNTIGLSLTWDFIRSQWDYLMNVYGAGFFSFSSLISGITETFNTNFRLQQLEEFVAKNPNLGTGKRAFEQAIEKTKLNIKWMEKNEKAITDWLMQQME